MTKAFVISSFRTIHMATPLYSYRNVNVTAYEFTMEEKLDTI